MQSRKNSNTLSRYSSFAILASRLLKKKKQNSAPAVKVIPFNCIAHPFYASFFAWLARAGARARSELDRFSVIAEQFREITGRFLLNELGDPHFLMHKFKWHTVEYNILRFQEKLKILLWDIFI